MSAVPAHCPRCTMAGVIPIVYGMVGFDDAQRQERGEIVLGGCIIEDGAPIWHCSNPECENEWGNLFAAR